MQKTLLILTASMAICPSTTSSAQTMSDPGPHLAGWRDVSFRDTNFGRDQLEARVYYPAVATGHNQAANPTNAPFPLVAFMHGWIEPASDYDDFCNHLATWGFVIISNDTELGLFPRMQDQAKDTRSMLQWVEDESATANSWLNGMTANQEWGALGHSMGASAIAYLVKYEPRVRNGVMFEPYSGSLLGNTSNGFSNFIDYDGSLLVVAGSDDLTNNWSVAVRPWYDRADSTNRRVWSLISGSDHFGCTDMAGWNGSLSGQAQHRVHRQLGTAYLMSEMVGDEDRLLDLLDTDYTSFEAESTSTPLWALTSPNTPNTITVGSFSREGNRLRVAGSFSTGSTTTIYGDVGIDIPTMRIAIDVILGVDGIAELDIPLDAAWIGQTIYFQALADQGLVGDLSTVNQVLLN